MRPVNIALVKGLSTSAVPLASLIDGIPLPVVILDKARRVLFFNRHIAALSGLRSEEARGLPCQAVVRGSFCPQECPAISANEIEGAVSVEGDIISRDRRRIPVRLTSYPLQDQAGRRVGFVETIEEMRGSDTEEIDLPSSEGFTHILGRSRRMRELFQILPGVIQSDSSVLLIGETGTGKDVVAEAIHQSSNRADGPFVKVNAGALPETLLESELFGHQKGAFTGAVANRPGRITLAHKGTLFLTEIGDLPLALQVKLLSFLDDQVVYPLGSSKAHQVDVRIIAATHRNLEAMVKDGRFREDLLFRLKVVQINLPPLREREEDIPLLLDHFLARFCSRMGKGIRGFSEEVRNTLLSYPYPGNVRELRNIIEYTANVCRGERIELEHLPSYLLDQAADGAEVDPSGEELPTAAHIAGRKPGPADTWSDVERRLILDALVKAKGRRAEAARILGWGRSTLWRKIKRHGLEREHEPGEIPRAGS